MIWIILAIVLILVSVVAEARRIPRWPHAAAAAAFALLAFWLWSEFGTAFLSSSEESRSQGFFLGALLAMVGEILILAGRGRVAMAVAPMAALAYATGLDVLRPDEYAYLPAAIVGVLVLFVVGRAFLVLNKAGKANSIALAAHSLAMAIMVYAALYKLMDRGWEPPWAFSVAAGALLFADAQLWLGWGELLGRRTVPAWVQSLAYLGGQALMIVAAGYHYMAFL